MRTTNVNMVRGCPYKKFSTQKLSYESFLARKFPDLHYYMGGSRMGSGVVTPQIVRITVYNVVLLAKEEHYLHSKEFGW